MKSRKLTLAQACARYPHRFTMQHCPRWALKPFPSLPSHGTKHKPSVAGKYPAPQYASDQEWYDYTVFPGEPGVHGNSKHCHSSKPTWPLGESLASPFNVALFQELTAHFQHQLDSAR